MHIIHNILRKHIVHQSRLKIVYCSIFFFRWILYCSLRALWLNLVMHPHKLNDWNGVVREKKGVIVYSIYCHIVQLKLQVPTCQCYFVFISRLEISFQSVHKKRHKKTHFIEITLFYCICSNENSVTFWTFNMNKIQFYWFSFFFALFSLFCFVLYFKWCENQKGVKKQTLYMYVCK